MRRKAILIIFMLLVSTGLIFLSKGLQNHKAPEQEAAINSPALAVQQDSSTAEVKEEIKSTPESSNASTINAPQADKTEGNANSSSVTQKTEDSNKNTKLKTKTTPVQAPNLIITDSISGKIILSTAVAYNGATVAQETIKALDSAKISYKVSTFGDEVYFSSINGLRERSAGPSSGWCYFVNGEKLSVGAGGYNLKKGDKLEWKFLKDGVSIN